MFGLEVLLGSQQVFNLCCEVIICLVARKGPNDEAEGDHIISRSVPGMDTLATVGGLKCVEHNIVLADVANGKLCSNLKDSPIVRWLLGRALCRTVGKWSLNLGMAS
jgi:hypothetical protein